ncbi:class I SAM-dependent methyltransferase [Arthrobacter sp. CAN_C5]|uniref:class I SAM-dependent methyltransferase n=1 Tax=Arthrobacter sp. CAN_C5 TaxID=2760706 RepID=UPI0028A962D5|nr:class I SAM-dependent methyltransferase [Arthrobacter sp. CAN_C5]MBP2215315.1 2-polyprenyl-3-methyl-5-hydroxy-6-metoxy-1,4-benzoquinol methylase [Arthrobacter sp. CAN_C5]
MNEETLWAAENREHPGHSTRYIQRFEVMRAEGRDLHGEARVLDAMAARGSQILDAGCGTGRVGGELARRGHQVTGVDADAELIAAAQRDHPQSQWQVADLSTLALRRTFDLIVCTGNVLPFLAPGTAPDVLRRLHAHLVPDGRLVVGFGSDRGYSAESLFADAAAAGLASSAQFSTWELRPWEPSSSFLVSILTRTN